MDTQGQRFQVFLQERAGAPHQDVGSVHAPDPEMALQNGRDVFTRRPECTSLWVTPVEAIFSRTRQELEQTPLLPDETPSASPESFAVFTKPKAASPMTFAGYVQAHTRSQALQLSLQDYQKDPPVFAWWILPMSAVFQTAPEEVEVLFEPARDKPFREGGYYRVITAMRQVRQAAENSSPDDSYPV